MGGNLGTKKQKQSQVPIPHPLIFSQLLGTPSHTTITDPTNFLIAFICLSSVCHSTHGRSVDNLLELVSSKTQAWGVNLGCQSLAASTLYQLSHLSGPSKNYHWLTSLDLKYNKVITGYSGRDPIIHIWEDFMEEVIRP